MHTVGQLKQQLSTEKEIVKALLSMGYRHLHDKDIYLKPVGFNIFGFNIKTNEWINKFIGADKKMYTYNLELYEYNSEASNHYDDFLYFIKDCETYAKQLELPSNFEFLTLEQFVDFI